MEQTFSPIPEERGPKQRGCFFYGCIASIILLVLIGIGIWLGLRYLGEQLNGISEDHPRELPVAKATDEEQQALRKRIEDFDAAVKAEPDKPAPPLILTADDVNALIASEPDMKGKVYVTIPGDRVEGEVSLPLGSLPLPGVRGRFFNGKAIFRVGFAAGSVVAHVESAEIKGVKVPDKYIDAMKGQNVLEEANKNPKNATKLARVESLEVKDGKIIVRLKSKAQAEAPKPEAPKEEPKPEPAKEEPKAAEPPKEEPKADAPKAAEPPKEEPKGDVPKAA